MPPKNSVKTYVSGGYYHLYNRGVEKRNIFKDRQDYEVFLSYLKEYLSPKDEAELQKQLADPKVPWLKKDKIIKLIRLNNFFDEIRLMAYILMPNHFHLLVNQSFSDSIDSFMNSLNTRYVMYFNKKHDRVGPLYQGVYKAVLVRTENQLLHLSAYIHANSLEFFDRSEQEKNLIEKFIFKQPSSLPEYLGRRKTNWVETKEILNHFSKSNKSLSYENFILTSRKPHSSIKSIIIE